jgi:hypothetical protein
MLSKMLIVEIDIGVRGRRASKAGSTEGAVERVTAKVSRGSKVTRVYDTESAGVRIAHVLASRSSRRKQRQAKGTFVSYSEGNKVHSPMFSTYSGQSAMCL